MFKWIDLLNCFLNKLLLSGKIKWHKFIHSCIDAVYGFPARLVAAPQTVPSIFGSHSIFHLADCELFAHRSSLIRG